MALFNKQYKMAKNKRWSLVTKNAKICLIEVGSKTVAGLKNCVRTKPKKALGLYLKKEKICA